MPLGELIGALLGWLGQFVEFLFGFAPRLMFVRCNERGVAYVGGKKAVELLPGAHWYWKWRTEVVVHEVTWYTLDVDPVPLETSDGVKVSVGMVLQYRISDVVTYEVDNYHPDENISEAAQAALCAFVKTVQWGSLQGKANVESSLLAKVRPALERFGVEVRTARPNHQVRLDGAYHVTGLPAHPAGL